MNCNMCAMLFTFAIVSTVFISSDSARILGVFHMSSYSHFVLGETLFKELARRGHDVTMISPFPQKTPVKNYRDLTLTKISEFMKERKRNLFDNFNIPVWFIPSMMGFVGVVTTELVFQDEVVQNLLNSKETFDIVITEQFINDAHKGLAYRFNASSVVLSTLGSSLWTNHLVGNPTPLAYVPNLFLSYSSHMTFYQRVENTLLSTFQLSYDNFYFFPKQNEILQKYIPGAPHLNEIMANTSLILLNSHISYKPAKPHMPNMVEVGGFHVNDPEKLPEDLQKFLDDAKERVIYFSMGGNLKSKDLPKEKVNQILRVIGKLKLKVLWKFEEDTLADMPPNLKIGKWLPQQSILAHPNVKLFITHGGLLSTIESLHYGIPVLGIPIFGDQKMNMAEIVEYGYGLSIQYSQLNEDNFYSTIKELIDNPKYLANAKMRSKILKDRPMKPMEAAIYWIEYVLRHKGATHFRSAAVDLSWYQYFLLDVILTLTAIILGSLAICYYLIKLLLNKRKASKLKQQ